MSVQSLTLRGGSKLTKSHFLTKKRYKHVYYGILRGTFQFFQKKSNIGLTPSRQLFGPKIRENDLSREQSASKMAVNGAFERSRDIKAIPHQFHPYAACFDPLKAILPYFCLFSGKNRVKWPLEGRNMQHMSEIGAGWL